MSRAKKTSRVRWILSAADVRTRPPSLHSHNGLAEYYFSALLIFPRRALSTAPLLAMVGSPTWGVSTAYMAFVRRRKSALVQGFNQAASFGRGQFKLLHQTLVLGVPVTSRVVHQSSG